MIKSNFKKKIIIGSANFTQKYGVDPIKINQLEIKKILKLSKKNNIFKIDTAYDYFKENKIYKKIDKKFKFITKITPDHNWKSLDYCKNQLEDHFEKLNGNKIETLLFHNVDILFKKYGSKIFKNIEFFKNKYFNKIGISIYDTKCLSYLISHYDLDVVQCPFNLLDKRIVESGWFKKLKKKGIEVHIRSIFLQGILVNKNIYKKKYFKKWKNLFSEWFRNLESNNISSIDYCLSDLLQYDFDQIIIGVNNYKNLNEILNFKIIKNKNDNKIINNKENDLQLIDPRKWELNEN